MEKQIAKVISTLFHPLLLPTYALLLLFSTNIYFVLILPSQLKFLMLGFVFITTFVLPSIMMFILLKAEMIKSLQMESNNERVIPLIIVSGFFFATYYFLREAPQSGIFNLFILGATILVLMCLLINFLYKISVHMVAIGGLLGTFTGLALIFHQDLTLIIFSIIIIAGIIGFARLKLKAHTPMQVYLGFLLGFVFMLGVFLFI